jgi:flagellin-like protein
MKTLRKIRKNAKALSPVVASIILIAVTVAVSIAVAAWMGALTVGFMGSSSLTITNVEFQSNNLATLTVNNTGTKSVTISQIKVNNVAATISADQTLTYDAGKGGTVELTVAWTAGNPYKFDIVDSTGTVVGAYQATAPS